MPFAFVSSGVRGFKWLRYRQSSVVPDPSSTDEGIHWIDRGPPRNRSAAKLDAGCRVSSACVWQAAEAWAASNDPKKLQLDKVEAWLQKAAASRTSSQPEIYRNVQLETKRIDARSKTASRSGSTLSGAPTEKQKGRRQRNLHPQLTAQRTGDVVQERKAA